MLDPVNESDVHTYSFSAAAPVYTGRAEAWRSRGAPVRLAAEALRWRAHNRRTKN